MRPINALIVTPLIALAALILPIITNAKSINLLAEPKDNAAVVGTIDLSAGIIPIYTPKGGLWMKIGDPRNGNTGWIKSSDLKDSNGNVISVSQTISEGDNGSKMQSVEMNYGQQLTPEQKKLMEQQLIQQQKNSAAAVQVLQKNLDELKKLYNQQFEIMQHIGFPAVPGVGSNPPVNQQAPASQPVPRNNQSAQ